MDETSSNEASSNPIWKRVPAKHIWSAVAILALVLALAAAYGSKHVWRSATVADVQQQIGQAVPVGTTPDKIIEYLDTHGLEHSPVQPPASNWISGHKYADVPIILATKMNTARNLRMHEDMQIVFVFDSEYRLSHFDVFPVQTGP